MALCASLCLHFALSSWTLFEGDFIGLLWDLARPPFQQTEAVPSSCGLIPHFTRGGPAEAWPCPCGSL